MFVLIGVLFLPTPIGFTKYITSADVSTAGLQSSSGQTEKQPRSSLKCYCLCFIRTGSNTLVMKIVELLHLHIDKICCL